MVKSIKITNGGIRFVNGSLEMVGTPNFPLDTDELLQSVGLMLSQKIGDCIWQPFDGVNWNSIFMRDSLSEGTPWTPSEALAIEIKKALYQELRINKESLTISVVEKENRLFTIRIRFQSTKSGEYINLNFDISNYQAQV